LPILKWFLLKLKLLQTLSLKHDFYHGWPIHQFRIWNLVKHSDGRFNSWFFICKTSLSLLQMKLTFNKSEKLKSEKLITQLFAEGESVLVYPLRMVYIQTGFEDGVRVKVGVSVSKRHFKNAVDRNRIKRLIREAYRLQKGAFFNNFSGSYALMILYIGKDGTDFETISYKIKQVFHKFIQKTTTG
jgi:ribonuclease P protein component